jgi:hypothetical protein
MLLLSMLFDGVKSSLFAIAIAIEDWLLLMLLLFVDDDDDDANANGVLEMNRNYSIRFLN